MVWSVHMYAKNINGTDHFATHSEETIIRVCADSYRLVGKRKIGIPVSFLLHDTVLALLSMFK